MAPVDMQPRCATQDAPPFRSGYRYGYSTGQWACPDEARVRVLLRYYCGELQIGLSAMGSVKRTCKKAPVLRIVYNCVEYSLLRGAGHP